MSPHRQIVVDFVKKRGFTTGAELGVQKGVLFHMLLDACPHLSMIGVDIGLDPEHRQKFAEYEARYPARARVYVMTTHEAAGIIPDRSLDFVFIDADHSYAAVKDDIACWQSKVATGGWLGGHDYHPRKWPGVVKAVNEAFRKPIDYGGTVWGVWP